MYYTVYIMQLVVFLTNAICFECDIEQSLFYPVLLYSRAT